MSSQRALNVDPIRIAMLRVFRVVAEGGSVSRAAERLWMSQPSVSLDIKRLEQLLGVKLFERKSNRLVLNDNGSALLRVVHGLEDLLDNFEAMTLNPREDRRVVTVGAHPLAAQHIVSPVLAQFYTEYPDTRVSFKNVPTGEISRRLMQNEIDLGFFGLHDVDPRVRTEPVYTEQLHFIAHEDHPLTGAESISPEEIACYPFVVYEPGTESRDLVERWALSHGVQLDVGLEVSAPTMIAEAVANQIGIGVAPGDSISAGPPSLRILPVHGAPLYLTIYGMYSSAAVLASRARALLDYVHARFTPALTQSLD